MGFLLGDNSALIEKIKGILVFNIQGSNICIGLDAFSAVINPNEVNPINSYSEIKERIISYKGNVIPLVDIHAYLGFDKAVLTDKSHLILLEKEERKVAFIVDAVLELVSFDRYIKETLSIKPPHNGNALYELEFEGRKILMPDFDTIYSLVN